MPDFALAHRAVHHPSLFLNYKYYFKIAFFYMFRYVAWVQITLPMNMDYGQMCQNNISTEDQVNFCFKDSNKSEKSGQIPHIFYKKCSDMS